MVMVKKMVMVLVMVMPLTWRADGLPSCVPPAPPENG